MGLFAQKEQARPGDTMTIEIDGIGELSNPVRSDD